MSSHLSKLRWHILDVLLPPVLSTRKYLFYSLIWIPVIYEYALCLGIFSIQLQVGLHAMQFVVVFCLLSARYMAMELTGT